MYSNCEDYYDSDEGVGIGAISLREQKALFKQQQRKDPTNTRRKTTDGRLQSLYPNSLNSTEYFTAADPSETTKNMAADSSIEDANRSINEVVSNIIRTLDSEESADEIVETVDEIVEIIDDSVVLELSDEESEDEIVNISSESSSDESETDVPRKSIPKFKINSPTSNLKQLNVFSTHNSPTVVPVVQLSESELLQDLSGLHLLTSKSSRAICTDVDESLLLRSDIEADNSFVDDERDDIGTNDSASFETAKDAPVSDDYCEINGSEKLIDTEFNENIHFNLERNFDSIEPREFLEHNRNNVRSSDNSKTLNFVEEDILESSSADTENCNGGQEDDLINFKSYVEDVENMKANENSDQFNSTLDRIEHILNSGSHPQIEEPVTPKMFIPVPRLSISAPNTPNFTTACMSKAKCLSPFKIPTKIPRSLRKEVPSTSTRSRFDTVKSPVAHYIKNSGTAPIIRNQPCGELTHDQLIALMEIPSTKKKIIWPKVTLTEKFYNRSQVQITSEHNKGKVLKLPANIEAITIDMGVIKRHLGHHGMSRLPVPQSPTAADVDLQGTFMAEKTPRYDVSLIAQEKVIIK